MNDVVDSVSMTVDVESYQRLREKSDVFQCLAGIEGIVDSLVLDMKLDDSYNFMYGYPIVNMYLLPCDLIGFITKIPFMDYEGDTYYINHIDIYHEDLIGEDEARDTIGYTILGDYYEELFERRSEIGKLISVNEFSDLGWISYE